MRFLSVRSRPDPPEHYGDGKMSTIKPRLVSITDACTLLSIGKTKLYELISDGQLDTVSIGSRRLITLVSIDALIEGAAENGA